MWTLARARLLAGDIGGTKTNLGLFEGREGRLEPLLQRQYHSGSFSGLEPMIRDFLKQAPGTIDAAAFGISGPVVDGHVETPNLPWSIAAKDLQSALQIPALALINDLEAMAIGATTLAESAFAALNAGQARLKGDRVVLAAGTGLGEAGLVWDNQGYRVIPSEGGHADFAPRNELEWQLCHFLIHKYGRASYERVLSGPGLVNLYSFFRERSPTQEPEGLRTALANGDPAAAITQAALEGRDPVSQEALNLFVSIYGAEAGNLALKFLATGGVYIGGGIALKILSKLQDGAFMKAFQDKGRLSALLSSFPVKVILDPLTPLYGAADAAATLLNDSLSKTTV